MYVIVIGCGLVGAELATTLSLEGNNVVIVDQDNRAFSHLGPAFNGIIITGHGFSR